MIVLYSYKYYKQVIWEITNSNLYGCEFWEAALYTQWQHLKCYWRAKEEGMDKDYLPYLKNITLQDFPYSLPDMLEL